MSIHQFLNDSRGFEMTQVEFGPVDCCIAKLAKHDARLAGPGAAPRQCWHASRDIWYLESLKFHSQRVYFKFFKFMTFNYNCIEITLCVL